MSLSGFVKGVLSSDLYIVTPRPPSSGLPSSAPVEKTVILDGVLGAKGSAREIARRWLIGKNIDVKITQSFPPEGGKPGREFAVITFDGKDVATELARLGAVRAKPNANEEIKAAEAVASAAKLGLWSGKEEAAPTNATDEDNAALFKRFKGQEVAGVVEYVMSGHSLKILLVPARQIIALTLSGVQCGTIKKGENGAPDTVGPQARESKYLAEIRVLHRDVLVNIEGTDKYGNLFGTVRYEGGNIGEEILRMGLGKIASWSIASTSTAAALRNAEKAARDEKLRVWRDFVAPTPAALPSGSSGSATAREYTARVVEAPAADCLILTDIPGVAGERKVFFSNIRVPKMGRKDEKPAPYAWEAREMIRKNLVGRVIKVFVDFVKPASEGFPEKTCVTTFTDNGYNFAENLVRSGLATVVKLRQDAEDRSLKYDDLLAAEAEAIAKKKGQHSSQIPPAVHFNEVSDNPAKAKSFLGFLTRAGKVKAVVDYVFSGSRVKVSVPKESASFILSLAGIRCNQPAKKEGEKSEPFADEALRMVRNTALQRDVEIEVYDVDKHGTFIGGVFIETSAGKVNLSMVLVKEGLAYTHFTDRIPFGSELREAEEPVKAKRYRIWEGYVDETPEENTVVDRTPVSIYVTEILSGSQLYAHVWAPNTNANEAALVSRITAETKEAMAGIPPGGFKPSRNAYCLAPYSEDGEIYRAKVLSFDTSKAQVFFIDYGNTETVDVADLRTLNAASIARLPPQAVEVTLAHLKVRPADDDEYGTEAAVMLRMLVWEKILRATIEEKTRGGHNGNGIAVTLTDPSTGLVVNNGLVRAGLATIKTSKGKQRGPAAEPDDRLTALLADMDLAKQGRLKLWTYGDCGDDDEVETSRPGGRRF